MSGPYPFSDGYLNMQVRRRNEKYSSKTPSGNLVEIPPQHWEDIELRDIEKVCEKASAINRSSTGLLLPFLNEYLLVDIRNKSLFRQSQEGLERIDNPLLGLLCLVYLLNVSSEPLSQEMISVHELKTSHFFKGPHELKVRPLLERYGNDLDGFKKTAERVGGEAIDMADAGYKFSVFPKVPLYYLFWEGDQEFGSTLSILFDRSVEHHIAADAIWGIVNLMSDILLMGDIRALF